ncbi:MAG: AAA family ATPase [Eggerthellaceae bacterium]|nr:AAA family ATPase [Eggerthellaceae bacterium]
MASSYFGGTISFKPEHSEQVLSALNLMIARRAKLIVGRSSMEGGLTVLPFGIKEEASLGMQLLESSSMSIGEFKDMLRGCDLKCVPLKPSVENHQHLKLASELEALDIAPALSMTDIEPKASARKAGQDAVFANIGVPAGIDATAADSSRARDPFADFIGLEKQVSVFRDLAETIRAYGRNAIEGLNVVLTGDPGTGKSSVAQAFASYARRENLVKGPFRQVSAENLIAKYAGQTPSLVREQWNRAHGGVFLLDEAYRLSQDTGGYGREAINTLNELMERDRDTLVICAGYRKEMIDFMDENPGLTHRFSFHVDFPRYGEDTLARIFGILADKRGFHLDEPVLDQLPAAFSLLKGDPHFANGRSARKLLDKCIIKQACYCGGGRTITQEALRLALEEERPTSHGASIGFVQ